MLEPTMVARHRFPVRARARGAVLLGRTLSIRFRLLIEVDPEHGRRQSFHQILSVSIPAIQAWEASVSRRATTAEQDAY